MKTALERGEYICNHAKECAHRMQGLPAERGYCFHRTRHAILQNSGDCRQPLDGECLIHAENIKCVKIEKC